MNWDIASENTLLTLFSTLFYLSQGTTLCQWIFRMGGSLGKAELTHCNKREQSMYQLTVNFEFMSRLWLFFLQEETFLIDES